MNGTEAVVLLFFMGVFAVTAKIAHGVKKGDIVMVKPTLSAIAEGLGLKVETEYDAPYWLQIVHAHGFEKALRGVVNTLKHGGQLVAEVNVFALYNKGVREMNAIPWRIGKELAKLNTQFECGCTEKLDDGVASCTEILEMAIKSLVEEHYRHNALARLNKFYLDRLASDAEIEADNASRWGTHIPVKGMD